VLPAQGSAAEFSSTETTGLGLHTFIAVMLVVAIAWYANIGELFYSAGTAPTFSFDEPASDSLDRSSSASLVVEVSDSTACPDLGPCELHLLINGKKISYLFLRREDRPDVLTSRDQLLVGHLATGGTASIEVKGSKGSTAIQLTGDNLVEVEQPGFISRWLGRFFNDQEGR
jgi:hypothetical protein